MDIRRNILIKHKRLCNCIEKICSLFPERLQAKILVHHRKSTGMFGLVVRYALLRNLAAHVGENVLIQPDVFFLNMEKLSIGDNVSIHPMSYIDALVGVEIGNNVTIAHGVSIISAQQSFNIPEVPVGDQGCIALPVKVGNDVYIGANASILGGSTVADGSVIGANVTVTAGPYWGDRSQQEL